MDDDDWLETPAQGSTSDPLVEQEYQRLASRYSDAGYREGITDGKLSTLQAGFDESFAASVTPSRRLGALRGRAAALLHLVLSHGVPPASGGHQVQSTSSPSDNTLVEDVRALMRDLGRVRRIDALPKDIEREQHEEEHGEGGEPDGGGGYILDETPERMMEGLQEAMGRMGGDHQVANGREGSLREDRLLDELEGRLKDLEARLRI